MTEPIHPVAIMAAEAPPRVRPSIYPEPFASRMAGRVKHPLGDLFGLTHFGVNLTRLAPGAVSALRHAHTRQDEFILVLEGHPTLVTDACRWPSRLSTLLPVTPLSRSARSILSPSWGRKSVMVSMAGCAVVPSSPLPHTKRSLPAPPLRMSLP